MDLLDQLNKFKATYNLPGSMGPAFESILQEARADAAFHTSTTDELEDDATALEETKTELEEVKEELGALKEALLEKGLDIDEILDID